MTERESKDDQSTSYGHFRFEAISSRPCPRMTTLAVLFKRRFIRTILKFWE